MTENVETPCVELAWTPTADPFWPFDRFYGRRAGDLGFPTGLGAFPGFGAAPRFRTDIVEHEDAFEVVTDLPGIPKEKIEVVVQGDELRIHAAVADPKENGTNFVQRERLAVAFDRTFQLSEPTTASAIQAKFENGVLSIRVPKPKAVPEERVAVA